MGDRARKLELDGIRGVAILLVLGYHTGLAPGGWIGVSLFFALSGYLITSLLLDQHVRHGDVGLPRFYAARAARLLPALLVSLLVLLLLLRLISSTDARLAAYGAGWTMLYLANVAPIFTPTLLTDWTWSLSLEEQFYALWPLSLRRALRRGADLRRLASLLVGLAVVIAVGRALVSQSSQPGDAYMTVRGDELLLGCAVALVRPRLSRLAIPAVAVLTAVAFWGALDRPYMLEFGITLTGIAAVVVVAAVADGFGRRVLGSRLFVWFGRISYALYLWNCVLGVALFRDQHGVLARVALVGASIGCATASTMWVEEPIRRRIRRGSHGPVREPAPVFAAAAPAD